MGRRIVPEKRTKCIIHLGSRQNQPVNVEPLGIQVLSGTLPHPSHYVLILRQVRGIDAVRRQRRPHVMSDYALVRILQGPSGQHITCRLRSAIDIGAQEGCDGGGEFGFVDCCRMEVPEGFECPLPGVEV